MPVDKDRVLDAYAAMLAERLNQLLAGLPDTDPSWVSPDTVRYRTGVTPVDRTIDRTLKDWA